MQNANDLHWFTAQIPITVWNSREGAFQLANVVSNRLSGVAERPEPLLGEGC